MVDERVKNLAKILVGYSIKVKKGDTVLVSSGTAAEPLVMCVYEELLRKGAFPVIKIMPDRAQEIFFESGKKAHFTTLTKYQRAVARNCDALIRICDETNTRSLSNVDPKKQVLLGKTFQPLQNERRKKPWLITLYPTEAYAQDADMSLKEFEEFVYGATFADCADPIREWKKLSARQTKIVKGLKGTDEVRIVGRDTDLKFSVKGRKFISSDGSSNNMPSGEIFTSPIETSAEGHISYDFPVCQYGREISGIRLVFRKGVVVEATAEKNGSFLRAMLDSDKGASRLGELGIGTNKRIQRFTKRILFDEKIGGTIHLALGSSYPETGGKNKSSIHWDMIKDLREEGAIYMNGKQLKT
jgi:aminopeptidase